MPSFIDRQLMSYRKISCVIKRKKRLIRIGENVIKLKFFSLTFTLPVFSFLKLL